MPGPIQDPADKASVRSAMRRLRRALPDRAERSSAIWAVVRVIPAVEAADRVLVFTPVEGEPDTSELVTWCSAGGKQIAVPEDHVAARWPDVVIVPGLAFTAGGHRLGQGGGWYDRFLAEVRPDCTTIGVGFDIQLIDQLPLDPHDVTLDRVVTESGQHFPS